MEKQGQAKFRYFGLMPLFWDSVTMRIQPASNIFCCETFVDGIKNLEGDIFTVTIALFGIYGDFAAELVSTKFDRLKVDVIGEPILAIDFSFSHVWIRGILLASVKQDIVTINIDLQNEAVLNELILPRIPLEEINLHQFHRCRSCSRHSDQS